MRLNLGEIATCLGCGQAQVIWDGPDLCAGFEPVRPHSLKSLVRQRADAANVKLNTCLTEARNWSNAPWSGLACTGAQIDSRKVQPGNLFFCLPGKHADGHEFALDAARSGARAIVALRNPFTGGEATAMKMVLPPVFLVDDVVVALGRLARCHRETSLARVVGITGTAGKTSVKEVLAQVLSFQGRTERNPLNLNNKIGLPLSMLNASADASFWVMEMGISEEGEMHELGRILHPDFGVILNIGDGHLCGLGGRGVAANKSILLEYILPGGVAVVSADYPELDREVTSRKDQLARRGIELLRFSHSLGKSHAHAEYIGPAPCGGTYRVWVQNWAFEVETPFYGGLGDENVAAIVSVAAKLGLSQKQIKEGIARARLPEQRCCLYKSAGFTVLDDSYNANPLSCSRMLRAAGVMAKDNKQPLILVMGEMLELGDKTRHLHEALGREMAALHPEAIFWKGGQDAAVRRGLGKAGYRGKLYPLCDTPEFSLLLEESGFTNALVLFKGSRGNKLEQLVAAFREQHPPAGEN